MDDQSDPVDRRRFDDADPLERRFELR